MPKRHLVTSALPYANGPLHIGHIAGAYLPADIYVRHLRRKLGHENVLFICGSDEHGAAISMKALKEKSTPKAIVDAFHSLNKKAFEDFGIGFDIYHRTTSELHYKTSQEFFLRLHERGVFRKESNLQMFDPEARQFLADRFVMGTCPNCSSDRAYGDQCEKCGKTLSPSELINPHSTLSGARPELRETWHFYLPMGHHEDWIRQFIQNGTLGGSAHHNPQEWRKQVVGQCLSWVDGGLGDRAMTRDLNWGVPVPLPDAEGKVLYVWLDAPIGYISATRQWAADQGNSNDWMRWWQDPETELIHFIGKDNIVFHCIIFPILLKMHGGYILPTNVPANEFLNLEGDKISTSRNHAVWLHEYLEDFPGRRDELRFVLTSIAPETKDSEFTWKDFQARVNNELVAILGNLVNRVAVLTHKFYGGLIPQVGTDQFLLNKAAEFMAQSRVEIEGFNFRQGLSTAMEVARLGNKYLADNEPWKLQKTDPDRVKVIMRTALELCVVLADAVDPFLPDTAVRIRELLRTDPVFRGFLDGHEIGAPSLLFAPVEDTDIERQTRKLHPVGTQQTTITDKPFRMDINFDDFSKMDIRIGTILAAERVEKADKLLKLSVDLGSEVRTIVSGIATQFGTDDVKGRQVTVLCNLEPRKIRGVESQGMILMAEDAAGRLSFICPDGRTNNGAVVR